MRKRFFFNITFFRPITEDDKKRIVVKNCLLVMNLIRKIPYMIKIIIIKIIIVSKPGKLDEVVKIT